MLTGLYHLARPWLFRLAPEDAHERTLQSLERGLYPRPLRPDGQTLQVSCMGLEFPNPIGVAAGFDKNARVPDAVLGMGCGFAEIGTVTPLAQPGNPQPRVFRLIEDNGLINRLGFNNDGHAPALARLKARNQKGIVGVNIGANKDSADRNADYVKGLETFYAIASYFTVNISSPNTPGLRDLQAPAALDSLLQNVLDARVKQIDSGRAHKPIVVKVAPDIADDDIAPVAAILLQHNVDGIAVSNTTLARSGLTSPHKSEAGGLSGRPLFERSTAVLARFYRATEGKIPLIGIGGIDSGEAAVTKLRAGATLLQLYTGLIFEGPGLIQRMKSAITDEVRQSGVSSVSALTGRDADHWASVPLV